MTASSQEQILAYSRLTSLINSMADAVIAVDEQVHIVLFNGAALNILDTNNIREGQSLSRLFAPIDKNNQPVDVVAMVHAAQIPTTSRDLRLKYKDGSLSNLYISIAPVHLGYGTTQHGYVILLRDITTEKSLEEERDEFISVVSHELRTPIAIAEGNISNAQLIASKGGDKNVIVKALKEAHSQIMYLSEMINDLSTLSRAETGKLTLEVNPINIHELIVELLSNYQRQAKNKGLDLKSDLDPKLEILYSSKLYVREMLQNFITNAIKYTPKGYVQIRAKQLPNAVSVTVTDTGIGISKADQEKIFDKFFRSEDYRTRQSGGTGLGLYVTMKLARLTNTDISFVSQLNKGSSFTLTIPSLKPLDTSKA